MFDKIQALLDMQKKMQTLKVQLENTNFEVESADKSVKVTMNGAQEVKELKILCDGADRVRLEAAVKEAVNQAIKRAQSLAAEKMKALTGLSLPGLA